jgi:predicted O-methyltransferase YrrM
MFKVTKQSLELTRKISDEINNQTFHHHYHILYDIASSYDSSYDINYLEIGCYAGGSACLMLQRPNTNVISIDIGYPIDKEIVIQNVNKLNKHNNKYTYIKGDSRNSDTVSKLERELNDDLIDILFIDGDHSYDGVVSDFNIYKKYLRKGGYIIFDDYNDSQYSPEVKNAVDNLELDGYEILGSFGDEFGARPVGLKSNEFVIKNNKNGE